MIEMILSGLERGLGLKPGQSRLLLRALWVILVTAFMLWASGILAWGGMGTPPFVHATDFSKELEKVNGDAKAVKQEVTEVRVQILEQELFEARLRQCKAESPEARQYYYQQLQEKMNKYFAITGRNYFPPDCKEVL